MRHLSTFSILLAATLLCGCSGTISKITITPADVKEQSSSTVSVNAVTDSNDIKERYLL